MKIRPRPHPSVLGRQRVLVNTLNKEKHNKELWEECPTFLSL
jgi:hypothetical protein